MKIKDIYSYAITGDSVEWLPADVTLIDKIRRAM